MSTYIAATLGCLTAMALVGYGKLLRERYRNRENLFFRDKDWSDNW